MASMSNAELDYKLGRALDDIGEKLESGQEPGIGESLYAWVLMMAAAEREEERNAYLACPHCGQGVIRGNGMVGSTCEDNCGWHSGMSPAVEVRG